MRKATLQDSISEGATFRDPVESDAQKKPYQALKHGARPGRGRPGMDQFHIVLLGLGAAFLAYLAWKIGLREIWREFVSLGWGLIPLVLAEGIAEMIHTLGWRHCMNEPYRSLPWFFLFRVRM